MMYSDMNILMNIVGQERKWDFQNWKGMDKIRKGVNGEYFILDNTSIIHKRFGN